MNTVNLCGKIVRIKEMPKVTYVTIAIKGSRNVTEFVPVTIFQTDFFSKYFQEKKWIGILGHIHVNNESHGYSTEIIADNIYFVGDKVQTWEELTSPDEIGGYEI